MITRAWAIKSCPAFRVQPFRCELNKPDNFLQGEYILHIPLFVVSLFDFPVVTDVFGIRLTENK